MPCWPFQFPLLMTFRMKTQKVGQGQSRFTRWPAKDIWGEGPAQLVRACGNFWVSPISSHQIIPTKSGSGLILDSANSWNSNCKPFSRPGLIWKLIWADLQRSKRGVHRSDRSHRVRAVGICWSCLRTCSYRISETGKTDLPFLPCNSVHTFVRDYQSAYAYIQCCYYKHKPMNCSHW